MSFFSLHKGDTSVTIHIVLVEPEIPANTGNIARTCAATKAHLHLIHPLGFSTDDRYLKRAGLDYWHEVKLHYYESFAELQATFPDARFFYTTTKATKRYDQFHYQAGDFFVFGKETKGLPTELLAANTETCIRMPMTDTVRSLNIANSVAVVAYEALRQLGFSSLK